MSKKKTEHQRLPRSFHYSFIPERQYIHALLRFAAAQKSGDHNEISNETGIPMGESSGKVPAIIDYTRAMGLIRLAKDQRGGIKKPELTPLGRIVFLEDRYLTESVTQWVAHFNMCSPLYGADVWYRTFFEYAPALGQKFSRDDLSECLALIYQSSPKGLIGPLIRTYEEDSAFRTCGVLQEKDGQVDRRIAPVLEEYCFVYGAWILQLIKEYFPKSSQITVTELNTLAGWRTIAGWNSSQGQKVLEIVEREGLIKVDRHMNPWILSPNSNVDDAWPKIYDKLI